MKPRRPPKLPKSVWSPLGPVRVVLVARLKPLSKDVPKDIDDFGQYNPKTRTIEVLRGIEPWQQIQTLRHEWFHMVAFDAGLHNVFNEEQIEVLCDVIGTALAAELRNA